MFDAQQSCNLWIKSLEIGVYILLCIKVNIHMKRFIVLNPNFGPQSAETSLIIII